MEGVSTSSTARVAQVDWDSNAGCDFVDPSPTENIHWPSDEAESGGYFVWVETYGTCDSADLSWHLIVRIRGQVVLDKTGYDSSDDAYVISYDPDGSARVKRVPAPNSRHLPAKR